MGRPKQNRVPLSLNVDRETPLKLKQIALQLGFKWGRDGNTGAFLDFVASCPLEDLAKLKTSN